MTVLVSEKLVGLLPAAGTASRIAPLPCSKEILPVGYFGEKGAHGGYAKTPIHYLLEQMHTAGVTRGLVVISPEKGDVPAYLKDGKDVNVDLSYLVARESWGVPFTLDRAFDYVKDKTVVFGFPDILIDQKGAFGDLLERLQHKEEDLVLGVFKANSPPLEDLVSLDAQGRVCRIEIKVAHSTLNQAWLFAVWRPRFSRFIRAWTDRWRRRNIETGLQLPEPYLGDVINAAISAGIKVGSVTFGEGGYLDIGTPRHLAKVVHFSMRHCS
jgi:glucose-1-phosphate thymidylyltransferase